MNGITCSHRDRRAWAIIEYCLPNCYLRSPGRPGCVHRLTVNRERVNRERRRRIAKRGGPILCQIIARDPACVERGPLDVGGRKE